MTVFNDDLDTARPAGSDDPAEADDNMRRIQAAVQERENVDHYWPLTGTEVSDADTGEHRKVTLRVGSAPSNVANKGFLYLKDVGAKGELHFQDEDGNEIVMSSLGNNLANATYLKATNKAGDGSVDLIKAGRNVADDTDVAIVPDLTRTASNAAPVEDTDLANKKYIDDHVGHDGDGYVLRDVDGTPTKVYVKYLTGTLDADSQTEVAHGVANALTKILHVSATVAADDSIFRVYDYDKSSVSGAIGWFLQWDATNVIFSGVEADHQSHSYRIKIDYIL